MTLYECAAHIDEHGNIVGGKPGDQTGKEVSVAQYSDYSPDGWDGVLRYCGPKANRVRNRMMQAAYKLAEGDKVGYNQNARATLFQQMQKRHWYLNKCGKIAKCNTDCSAFVGVLANIGMLPLKVGKEIPSFVWTGCMVALFQNAGFKWIRSGIDFKTGKGLMPGDVLLNIRNHTSLFMGNKRSGQLYTDNSNSTETKKETQKKPTTDAIANKVINGDFGDGDERVKNLKEAGYDPVAVQKRVNELLKG